MLIAAKYSGYQKIRSDILYLEESRGINGNIVFKSNYVAYLKKI